MNTKVLVAGASGYLGTYISKELVNKGFDTRIIVRDKAKIHFTADNLEVVEAHVTKSASLQNICNDVEIVISALGITKQKDGLEHMDVDYQANANILQEAKKSGVKKFICISVLNCDKLRHLRICEAKEKFVDELKASGLDYCVVRPNGFFSDMSEFLKMAQKGKIYLLGNGEKKLNPIHGADLAEFVVKQIHQTQKDVSVGGPEIFSHNEIAKLALHSYSKPAKLIHIPIWITKVAYWLSKPFINSNMKTTIEFFITTMMMDMQAPKYGNHKLGDFYNELVKANDSNN